MADARQQRGVHAERAILDATGELLAERGVHELTVERVAARAGVAKTTIYRRWRGKRELALAVLLDTIETADAVPDDLGDTRAELISFVGATVRVLRSTLMGRVMQGLVSDLAADPKLARAFRERIVGARMAELAQVIERGIERDALRPDIDLELAHELLFGPVYYRLLLSGSALDDGLAERVVDSVLPSIARNRR